MRCAVVLAVVGVVLGANAARGVPVPGSGPGAHDGWVAGGAGPGCAVVATAPGQKGSATTPGPPFRAVLEPGGSGLVSGRSGDLEFQKRVYPGGRSALHLARGADVVDIVAQPDRIEVTRQGKTMMLELGRATEEDYLEVRALVAGSAAVAMFRAVASTIGPPAGRTPGDLAVRLSGVLLAAISGDEAAVERFVVGLRRPHGSAQAAAVPAATRRVLTGGPAPPSCYESWESEVIRAWDDYWACLEAFHTLNLMRQACALRYVVWAESSWFAFLGCTAIPAND